MTESGVANSLQRMQSLEPREGLDVPRILSLLALRPYLVVADVGCGPGLFTIPMAKNLWDGKVYAWDEEEEMLKVVRQRAQEARLGNIVTQKLEGNELPANPASLDGALLASTLHGAGDRGALLKGVAKALRRSGWCAVIEARVTTEDQETPSGQRPISEDELARLADEAGLRVAMRRELSDYYYLVVLRK